MRFEKALAIPKRHERLLHLVRAGDYSASGLAVELSVSEPTVNRDILFLRQHGYRLKAVRAGNGWAYRLSETRAARRPATA